MTTSELTSVFRWRPRLTHPRAETSEETPQARLFGERAQSIQHGTLGSVTLVDLREQRVSRLEISEWQRQSCWMGPYVGEDRCGETGYNTRSKGDSERRRGRQVLLGLGRHLLVDELGTSLIHSELTWVSDHGPRLVSATHRWRRGPASAGWE